MTDSGLSHRVSDEFIERMNLVAEAILLERAGQALRRRGYVDIPAMIEDIAAEWRGKAEAESG